MNVIGKRETFRRDFSYIFKSINLQDEIPSKENSQDYNIDDKRKFYRDQLSDKMKMKLYKVYEVDFKMFGYDVE